MYCLRYIFSIVDVKNKDWCMEKGMEGGRGVWGSFTKYETRECESVELVKGGGFISYKGEVFKFIGSRSCPSKFAGSVAASKGAEVYQTISIRIDGFFNK